MDEAVSKDSPIAKTEIKHELSSEQVNAINSLPAKLEMKEELPREHLAEPDIKVFPSASASSEIKEESSSESDSESEFDSEWDSDDSSTSTPASNGTDEDYRATEDEPDDDSEADSDDDDSEEEDEEEEEITREDDVPVTAGHRHKYQCPGCPLSFRGPTALLKHRRTELGIRPFHCTWPGCSRSTATRPAIKLHIRTVHFKLPATKKKELQQNGSIVECNPAEFIRRDDRWLRPDYGKRWRLENSKKNEHPSTSQPFVDGTPNKKFKLISLVTDAKKDRKKREKTLPCYFNQLGRCNCFFRSEKSRQVHYRIHLTILPFFCTYPGCANFRAEQQSKVFVHIRKDHFGLPATLKEQRQLGIKDKRNHRPYIGVTRELLQPCFTNLPVIS